MKIVSSFSETNGREVNWDFGHDMAVEILESIQLLATNNIKRIDGDGFKAYWAGEVLRIDIPRSEVVK